jgi:hypothetical protein
MLKNISLLTLVMFSCSLAAQDTLSKKLNHYFQMLPKDVRNSIKISKNIGIASIGVSATYLAANATNAYIKELNILLKKNYNVRDSRAIGRTSCYAIALGLGTILSGIISSKYLYQLIYQYRDIVQDREINA